MLELIGDNLLSPILLAFFMGIAARVVKSDLEISEPLYVSLSIYLLLAIGLKGGVALSITPVGELALPILATIAIGIITPLIAFALLYRLFSFSLENAAATAAHYGSVSAVTFLACLSFLEIQGVPYEGYVPALMAILEIPGIGVALLLFELYKNDSGKSLTRAVREILFGKSLFLLIGGLLIGLVSGQEKFEPLEPLFVDPFKGILLLFLLALGLQCGNRLGDVRRAGLRVIAFAIALPVLHAALGMLAGKAVGMSLGGTVVLGVLAGSASYIAAPAAVRIAIPKASPALYLTCSLAITFPFNIVVGIPLYYHMAKMLF